MEARGWQERLRVARLAHWLVCVCGGAGDGKLPYAEGQLLAPWNPGDARQAGLGHSAGSHPAMDSLRMGKGPGDGEFVWVSQTKLATLPGCSFPEAPMRTVT